MTVFPDRQDELLKFAPVRSKCLEVAPFHRPALLKSDYDVDYTDYATTEELRAKTPVHEGISVESVCAVDYVWTPGKSLRSCIPNGVTYDFAIASHVMEHVPDVLGWAQQIFDVMRPGAVFQLALPDHRGCFDVFRRPTDISEMLQNWITNNDRPNVGQIYDFLSKNVVIPDATSEASALFPFGENPKMEDFKRNYSDESALHFALVHFKKSTYMDTHCSVFTPESLVEAFSAANNLGIFNIELEKPVTGAREFFIAVKKIGEPRIRREEIYWEKEKFDRAHGSISRPIATGTEAPGFWRRLGGGGRR